METNTSAICNLCGRPLVDPESVKLGVGPDCAEKQQAFLSGCGTSVEEIGQLALLGDPTVSRWVQKFSAAMRLGHVRNAGYFIQAARRAAEMREVKAA
jgi:hypothetical protein